MTPADKWMRLALAEARKGLGQTAPNPPVGAVIIKDGNLVSSGWHQKAGSPHAEVEALRASDGKAAGAELYVTLEPCCIEGRTPACTQQIINAGITKVWVGCLDPNPRVNGKGIKALHAAGIDVETGIEESEATELIRGFSKWMQHRRPYVHLKAAVSLDGRLGPKEGPTRWLSSEEALVWAHQQRKEHDAILVGIGTLLRDDPELTCRKLPTEHQPKRILLDSQLRAPVDSKIFNRSETVVFCSKSANLEKAAQLEAKGTEVIQIADGDGGLDLGSMLDVIGERGITSLLVEGGSQVHSGLIKARLADEISLILTSKILGQAGSVPLFSDLGSPSLAEALSGNALSAISVGPDLWIRAKL